VGVWNLTPRGQFHQSIGACVSVLVAIYKFHQKSVSNFISTHSWKLYPTFLLLRSVPRIVALITVRANMGKHAYLSHMHTPHAGFYTAQAVFWHSSLNFFSKFPHLKNWVYQWIMQKNIASIIFTMKATILDTHCICYLVNLVAQKLLIKWWWNWSS